MSTVEEIFEDEVRRYTFTDGAHITPIFYEGKWVWMVTEFDGDTYCDGDIINPDTVSDSIASLAYRLGMEEDEL